MKAKERRKLARQITEALKPTEWENPDSYAELQERKKEKQKDMNLQRARQQKEYIEEDDELYS